MTRRLIRLLVVDDDAFVQRTIAEFVAAAGDMDCVGACSNGAEAVQFVADNAVDVVLMDVKMPIMDGVEAARRLLEAHEGIRVLMWTSFDDDDAVTTAMSYGASGFLVKTCAARTLIDAIRAAHGGMAVLAPDQLRVLQQHRPKPADAPDLTARETEVLWSLGRGLSNPEIAAQLYLSESSVKAHLASIMAKLNVHTRVKVVLRAHELGLLQG